MREGREEVRKSVPNDSFNNSCTPKQTSKVESYRMETWAQPNEHSCRDGHPHLACHVAMWVNTE